MEEKAVALDRAMMDVTDDLAKEFGGAVPPEIVQRIVADSFSSFSGSRIQSFVPVLARRQARQHLRRLAASDQTA